MSRLDIPDWMEAVFGRFKTAELSTVRRHGAPATAPLSVGYQPDAQEFFATTAVAFPQKVYNLRRDPTLSLLYSYPVGSGIEAPSPVVLVQGRARVDDDLVANGAVFEHFADTQLQHLQPSFGEIWRSPFWRWLYRYYLLRIFIRIRPLHILGWEDGDLGKPPLERIAEPGPEALGPAETTRPPIASPDLATLRLSTAARRRLERFAHGVLSVREPSGGPIMSIPCRYRGMLDDGGVLLGIEPGPIPASPGPRPAGLCFHTHDAQLGQIGQQLLTGAASVDRDGAVRFLPQQQSGYDPLAGLRGKLMLGLMTRARGPRYFRRRPGPTPEMIPRPRPG